eukprot:TRINITY_DN12208_c0_g2_i2.p1 TRINITY_DN12208_c0_g2~~TRINITY_DN12208_c0_g2_i2.p1  ORF type:complete len:612 (+),score=171.79 TRINITY_DN12208_c0_g2_i2:92-1837(+)
MAAAAAAAHAEGPPPPASLPPFSSLKLHVVEPTKREDYMEYKVSIRGPDGAELHYRWRRFREFEEAFKALRVKAKEASISDLPEPPPKKAFGRFDPKFVEERRKALEDFLVCVQKHDELTSTSEFQALVGLFSGGGYLRKLGARTIAFKDPFKRRWFEIDASGLSYYEKQGGKKFGVIELGNTRVVECTMYKHSFCIMGPNLPRTYILVAETDTEQRLWKRCLEQAGGGNTNTPGIGSMEGVDDPASAEVYYNGGSSERNLGLKDFDLVCVVGVGSFGKVMKVVRRQSGQVYAMKVLNKDQIIQNKMVAHTNAEKHILETVDHPFICKLHYAFQTKKQLILVLDFLSGGELFYHLQGQKRFSEARAKFYTAEIALAIAHLHEKGVIYRDLKPENLVLDHEGHITLTDFGLAKIECRGTTYTFCGTPEYMAPELVTKQGHTNAVDWWSLGIFLYEMVVGIPPFYSQNVSQMYQLILNKKLDLPSSMSSELGDVLTKLLDRDPKHRLCDLQVLKSHPFFADLDFDRLLRREIHPEFVPVLGQGESDTKYFDAEFTKQPTELPGGDDDQGKDVGAGKFTGFAQG